MSAISDFTTKLNAFFDRQDTAITDIQGDIKFLKETIDKLQTSPGPITPEDQALLDAMQDRVAGTTTKVEAVAGETPPPVPPG